MDRARPHLDEPMDHGHHEPSQLRLNDKIPQEVSVPNKPLVGSLMQGQLKEVGLCLQEMLSPLKGVREIVRIGEVEAWGGQDALNHG